MSIIDKVVSAVTPNETAEERAEARRNARQLASPGDWLSTLIDHHERIETCFERLQAATEPDARVDAQMELARELTGHAVAEDCVIYPAMAWADDESHATRAYTEQSAAKMQLGLMEHLDPASQDYVEKLDHVRNAVLHHIYNEEHDWFPELKRKLSELEQEELTERALEEYERYMGSDSDSGPPSATMRRGAAQRATQTRTAPSMRSGNR